MASYIDNVKKIEDKQKVFVANSQEDNTQSLANYLPNGSLYINKNEKGSNLRRMLSALSLETIREEKTLQDIADEYYPFTTTKLLEEWEKAVGIPDDCFIVDGIPIEQRRKQVIVKLAFDRLINKDDFIALAAFLGYTITITNGFEDEAFPYTFPFRLAGDEKEQKFTVIIKFVDVVIGGTFPYIFPFIFDDQDETQFLQCLLIKLFPANVNIVFEFKETT